MIVSNDLQSLNPYDAPKAASNQASDDVEGWAWQLRANYRREERNVRFLTWFNFVVAASAAPAAIFGTVVIVDKVFRGSTSYQMIRWGPLVCLIAVGSGIVGLNLWIWYELRRFSPLSRAFAVVQSTIGFLIGLGTLLTLSDWMALAMGLPLITFPPALFIYLLFIARSSYLFTPQYQLAITLTRRQFQ